MPPLRAILRIAARNALRRKVNLTIGLVVLIGTGFLVFGLTMLQSIQGALGESLRSTMFGDVDVYSSASEGGMTFSLDSGIPKEEPIAHYPKVRDALLALPEVKGVVPMAFQTGTLLGGNGVDRLLAKLRQEVNDGALQQPREKRAAEIALEQKVQFLAGVMREDLLNSAEISNRADLPRARAALEKASSDAFWKVEFPRDPLNALEFLENRVAPEDTGRATTSLFLAGTDLGTFRANFNRLKLITGAFPPEGAKGILIPNGYYEDLFKLKLARRLDQIKQGLDRGATLADDSDLAKLVAQNKENFVELIRQLDPASAHQVTQRLQSTLGHPQGTLRELLPLFFDMNDANFAARYRFFYDQLAPLLDLYSVHVGDVISVKAEARSGYMRGVNLKVYGTFEFTGLEESPLVGQMCLTDLKTMQVLLGLSDPGTDAEVTALEQRAGLQFISKDAALAGLGEISEEPLPQAQDARPSPSAGGISAERASPEDSVLVAVVRLRDPGQAAVALAHIQEMAKAQGLAIKAFPAASVAGIFGQMVKVGQGVMLGIAAVVFLILGVILNSAALFVTLRRIPEIGTLRALGAQRDLVVALVVVESLLVVLLAGALGTGMACGVLLHLSQAGLSAPPGMNFFFGGPTLYPQLHGLAALLPFGLVAVMCGAATFYPAMLAARVSPLRAMQSAA